jgi:hypothetical protein
MTETFMPYREAKEIKDWQPREPRQKFPFDLATRIGWGEIPCPICGSSDMKNCQEKQILVSATNPGKLSYKNHTCTCVFYKLYVADIKGKVPLRYQQGSLKSLQPSEKSMLSRAVQIDLIKELQANPDNSYAFFGPAGTSKTTYALALYKQVIFQMHRDRWMGTAKESWDKDNYCWRIAAKQLLEQHHDYATNRSRTNENGDFIAGASTPMVTRQKIDKAVAKGFRPRLFLEELDKVKSTQFRLDTLFEIVDGLYEQKGQLVINSNMTPTEFSATFGSAFERRLAEMCTVKDFFETVDA